MSKLSFGRRVLRLLPLILSIAVVWYVGSVLFVYSGRLEAYLGLSDFAYGLLSLLVRPVLIVLAASCFFSGCLVAGMALRTRQGVAFKGFLVSKISLVPLIGSLLNLVETTIESLIKFSFHSELKAVCLPSSFGSHSVWIGFEIEAYEGAEPVSRLESENTASDGKSASNPFLWRYVLETACFGLQFLIYMFLLVFIIWNLELVMDFVTQWMLGNLLDLELPWEEQLASVKALLILGNTLVIVVVVIGLFFFFGNPIGERGIRFMEAGFKQVPGFRRVYYFFRELCEGLWPSQDSSGEPAIVAWLPDPRGMYFLGSYRPSHRVSLGGNEELTLYVLLSALSFGFLVSLFVPKDQFIPSGMTIQEAMKLTFTSGFGVADWAEGESVFQHVRAFNSAKGENNGGASLVFVPFPTNPFSGVVVLACSSVIVPIRMTAFEVVTYCLSCGLILPHTLRCAQPSA